MLPIKIKPFASIIRCPRCGRPMVKGGLTFKTSLGNVSTSSKYYCLFCFNKKSSNSYLNRKGTREEV